MERYCREPPVITARYCYYTYAASVADMADHKATALLNDYYQAAPDCNYLENTATGSCSRK